jgi:hypothetical protein
LIAQLTNSKTDELNYWSHKSTQMIGVAKSTQMIGVAKSTHSMSIEAKWKI